MARMEGDGVSEKYKNKHTGIIAELVGIDIVDEYQVNILKHPDGKLSRWNQDYFVPHWEVTA